MTEGNEIIFSMPPTVAVPVSNHFISLCLFIVRQKDLLVSEAKIF